MDILLDSLAGVFFGLVGWIAKETYQKHGCVKRIEGIINRVEQKLDDFIKYHVDKR